MTDKEKSLKELEKDFGNDLDLMLFYVSWIKNGLEAKKAYKEFHLEPITSLVPSVTSG